MRTRVLITTDEKPNTHTEYMYIDHSIDRYPAGCDEHLESCAFAFASREGSYITDTRTTNMPVRFETVMDETDNEPWRYVSTIDVDSVMTLFEPCNVDHGCIRMNVQSDIP
jgi:hypothetical protein